MAANNFSAYLSAVKWKEEDLCLQDFPQKYALPQVARIVKGQYLNLGTPSLSSPSLNQIVFLAHAGKRLKVAAQCVKFKDGSRVLPVGNKLAIPDNYDGWFEILSEDGKAVRCIDSVAELLKLFPETCLVRENIKAYMAKTDDVELISDKTKTVAAGETLVLVSQVHHTPVRAKSSGRYLRCFTTNGETVFLNVDQKGKFSPVAGEDSISGVHTIKNLLSKRFPLMVRLVHGKSPVGIKLNSHFLPEMRLYSLFEEESIVALPLLKESHIVVLPPSAQLKVQALKNSDSLMKIKDYDLLLEKCKSLVQEASNKIQVFDIALSKEIRAEPKSSQPKRRLKNLQKVHRVQRSASDPNGRYKEVVKYHSNPMNRSSPPEPSKPKITDENYDEIDQIYDYVRGFASLPQKIVCDFKVDINGNIVHSSQSVSHSSSPVTTNTNDSAEKQEVKPVPPPIETIPARKISREETEEITKKIVSKSADPSQMDLVAGHIYEKVGCKRAPISNPETSKSNRLSTADKKCNPNHVNHGVKKILTKNSVHHKIQHKSLYLKHSKSSPALKEKSTSRHRTNRSKSLTTSPLFNIRYKSLINLAEEFDAIDCTNSGGQISLDSGNSKETKKLSKKLQRPKSLTDLFGDVNRDNLCKHGNIDSTLTNGIENRKLIFSHESANGKMLNGPHNKQIGILYL